MWKKLIKPIVLLCVFVCAIIGFSVMTNKANEDLTTTMAEATLPILYFQQNGLSINELHGYTTEMNPASMRDSITPIGEDRELEVMVRTYGMEIDRLSFQVRSMDGNRLIAESDAEEKERSKNNIHAVLKIQNLLNENEEYNMILLLHHGEEVIYYYTRIMRVIDNDVNDCISFALQFHEYTFREDADTFIPTYMDPATGDATTLQYVDLTCTLKQITWANFKGEVLTEPVISIKEIQDSYDALTLKYVLSFVNEQGETELYNIEEYYRLRQTSTRMYVLNFERTMNQIFRADGSFVQESSSLILGIRESAVEYRASEAGNMVCFVQQGELWLYDISKNTIVKVFSFRGLEGIDIRENWDEHDIKIVRMDEAGSIDFIVYGYMNRGEHEGEVGMVVYHYDGIAHTIEEEAFLPSVQSYEILKAEMGQLMYENEMGQIYLMLDGTVYCIDLTTLKVKPVIEGLSNGTYAISDSHRYFAWVDPKQSYQNEQVHLMDLGTGKVSDIQESAKMYLRPLGFIGEDFIYGAADAQMVTVNAAGTMEFPMKYIKFMELADTGYKTIKKYEKTDRFISKIEIANTKIVVHLLQKLGEQYIEAASDSIMNRETEQKSKVLEEKFVTDVKQTQVKLKFNTEVAKTKLKKISPKSVILEQTNLLVLDTKKESSHFYVYEKGDVLVSTENIAQAIQSAYQNNGVVVDQNLRYIWMRTRSNGQSEFKDIAPSKADEGASSITQCISAMLVRNGTEISVTDLMATGDTPMKILESTLQEQTVLNLTGCKLDEVLYYVSKKSPVFALAGTNRAVLITGYSTSRIYYFDPLKKGTQSMDIEEAQDWFAASGNLFITIM